VENMQIKQRNQYTIISGRIRSSQSNDMKNFIELKKIESA